MVQLWIVVVVGLFAAIQLGQWLAGMMLPLPLAVIGGAFLAIASNYENGFKPLGGGSTFPVSLGATVIPEEAPALSPSADNPDHALDASEKC